MFIVWFSIALGLAFLTRWQFRQFPKHFGPAAMLDVILGTLWGLFATIAMVVALVTL